ncbi:sensor histidine kinase [Paenibacillus sp. FSL R5-0517]|uniref:sensor histidine kinase n=1 Tax=Paenibacillus sp. FSL R5-0517 TaxID=2921647 RepID=UPI0030D75040
MWAFLKYRHTLSFQKKLILFFLPLALIPMIFLAALSSWIYNDQISQGMNRNLNSTVNLINDHLNTYLNELTRLSVLPYYNNTILEIMQGTDSVSTSDYYQVQGLLVQAIRNPREDLQSVFIYRRDGQIFSSAIYNANINDQYNFKDSEWYHKSVKANGKVVFMGKANDPRILNRPEPTFSIARAIKIYNGPIIGVIIIDVNFTGFASIFQNVNLGNNSNIVVLDQNKHVVYSKNEHYLSVASEVGPDKPNVQAEGEQLIISQIQSEKTGWSIMGIVSETELNQGKATVYKLIFTVAAIVFFVILMVSVFLSNTITKPLRTLRRLMGRVERGDFNVAYNSLDENVEISQVGRAFNKMNQRIDELINQVLEIRYKQKEAELNNLKLQIRPHFLYNNLEAIRALAEMGDREGITEMTSALGGMLRYSLNKQDTKVTLRQELEQVQNYIKIEKIRSGDSLVVHYDVDTDLLDCMTIPILIQPIVENCIHHAFNHSTGVKQIELAILAKGDDMVICLKDNGIGITAERLTQLSAYLRDDVEELPSANFGIGLKNVHTRIQLEYGPTYGLFLFSEYQKGMIVELHIPKRC